MTVFLPLLPMLAMALSVTYLGAALCYTASSKSVSGAGTPILDGTSPWRLRVGGIALLGLGLVLFGTRGPVGEGILVWLSMGMASFSLLVVTAPLVDRFVPTTSALALVIAVLAPLA